MPFTEKIPLLSVIVPAYNSEKTIYSCVISICNQTYSNLDIVIVDDGSTDETYNICRELEKQDSRIRVVRQENSGPSKARNTGIKMIKGELLAFVDADDTIKPDMYEIMYNIMCESDCDVIICDAECIDKTNRITSSLDIVHFGVFDPKFVAKKIICTNNLCGGGFPWNKLINYKQIFEKSNKNILFNENFVIYEDKCWLIDILEFSEKVYITDKKLYNYVISSTSLSHDVTVKKRMLALNAWDYMYERANILFDKIDMVDIFKKYTEAYINNLWMFRFQKENCMLKKWYYFRRTRKSSSISVKLKIKYLLLYYYLEIKR